MLVTTAPIRAWRSTDSRSADCTIRSELIMTLAAQRVTSMTTNTSSWFLATQRLKRRTGASGFARIGSSRRYRRDSPRRSLPQKDNVDSDVKLVALLTISRSSTAILKGPPLYTNGLRSPFAARIKTSLTDAPDSGGRKSNQFMQDQAKGILVTPDVQLFIEAPGLLRRHVCRGTNRIPSCVESLEEPAMRSSDS